MENSTWKNVIKQVAMLIDSYGVTTVSFDRDDFIVKTTKLAEKKPESVLRAIQDSLDPYSGNAIEKLPDGIDLKTLWTGMLLRDDTIAYIFPDSPASRALLQIGDQIIGIGLGNQTFDYKKLSQALILSNTINPLNIQVYRQASRERLETSLLASTDVLQNTFNPSVKLISTHLAYVTIPPILLANSQEHLRSVIQGLHNEMRNLESKGVCNWIVDLRTAIGLHHYEYALLAVAPLVGDGLLLQEAPLYKNNSKELMQWINSGSKVQLRSTEFLGQPGQISDYSEVSTLIPITLQKLPTSIAVLSSDLTNGVGLAQAMAFSKRANSKSFGWFRAHGSNSLVRNSYFNIGGGDFYLRIPNRRLVDHTGMVSPLGLYPEVNLSGGWSTLGSSDDGLVREAEKWSSAHSCN